MLRLRGRGALRCAEPAGARMLLETYELDGKIRRLNDDIGAMRDAISEIASSLRRLGADPVPAELKLRWHRTIDRLADVVIEVEDVV